MKLHHAITKKATRLGVEIIEIPGELPTFRAIRADGAESAIVENASELLNQIEAGTIEWATPKSGRGLKSGVMVMSYHLRYTLNGGGCGDTLDETLRDMLLSEEGTDLDLLRKIADTNEVWMAKWAGLNPGMQRMNLANRLRARLRNDADFQADLDGEVGRFGIRYQPNRKQRRRAERAAAAQVTE